MFLAFLQDFIAFKCIKGDRLISTPVTCKLECLTPLVFQSIIFEINTHLSSLNFYYDRIQYKIKNVKLATC